MHRSGTSLLSRIIEYNSVFLGSYKDINNESIYFQNINKWLMSINSSSWDNPSSFLDSINTDNLVENIYDHNYYIFGHAILLTLFLPKNA